MSKAAGLDRLATFYDVYVKRIRVAMAIASLAPILGKGGRRNL
jgi:hypothetical protein